MSMWNTRFKRCAHVMAACASAGVFCFPFDGSLPARGLRDVGTLMMGKDGPCWPKY